MKLPVSVVVLLILGICDHAFSEIDAKTKKRITTSVETAVIIVDRLNNQIDALKEAGKAISPILGNIGKLAPFIGVAGGFLSVILAFLPQKDSVVLKYMKEQFSIVNRKLDKISDNLEDIKTLITFETQRSAYITAENDVNFGFEKLNQFYDELEKTQCQNKNECIRIKSNIALKYLPHFAKVEQSLDKILKGSVVKTVFREPLLDLARKNFKCDVSIITQFAESVTRLAERGQQVVITHERLTGSETSVVNSLKRYLRSIYDLRDYYYAMKNDCFKNIDTYISADVKDTKYQSDYKTDRAANEALGAFLEKKYGWLYWNVFSYLASGWQNHAFIVIDGSYSMPDRKVRERVLFAIPVDPKGTYTVATQYRIIQAIKDKEGKTVTGCYNDKSKCLDAIIEGIKAKRLYNYVQSIAVLKKDDKYIPAVRQKIYHSYINDVFNFDTSILRYMSNGMKVKRSIQVRVVIMLRSKEMLQTTCTKSCHATQSTCVRLPYSKLSECQCKPNFDGEECKEHSKNRLATSLDMLVSATLKIPTLVDIYYNIDDLREEINAGTVALKKLKSSLETSFKRIEAQLGQKFQWTNLKVTYTATITNLRFYIKAFKDANEDKNAKRRKELAAHVLKVGNLRKWLDGLNNLFVGDYLPIVEHQPLMIMYMNKYSQDACTVTYKQNVDNAFKQFAILQQKAYLMWAEALDIEEKDSVIAAGEYEETLEKQNAKFTKGTCNYDIPHSTTVNCTGGRYTHPEMKLKNTCEVNYYLKGSFESKCTDHLLKSACISCSCDSVGSQGAECMDQTGKCTCKSRYYGDKCQDRNCEWGSWGSWTSCSKECDYGGTQYRTLSHAVTRYGKGKACTGVSRESRSCFNRCCNNGFDCSNRKKCISASYKCNYDNDCGDKQDEKDSTCQETCVWKYSSFDEDGGGNVRYLDRQSVDCGSDRNWVLQSFKLEVNWGYGTIRYKYRCCQLNKDIAEYRQYENDWTDVKGVTYLDRQSVRCSSSSYINAFILHTRWENRGFWRKDKHLIKYSYYCDELDHSKHRDRSRCNYDYTDWNSWGNRKSYYLDRHDVNCRSRFGSRWFLKNFKLETSTSQMRYKFWCCRIYA